MEIKSVDETGMTIQFNPNLRTNPIFDEFRHITCGKLFTLTTDIPQLNIPTTGLGRYEVSQALVANWLLHIGQVVDSQIQI